MWHHVCRFIRFTCVLLFVLLPLELAGVAILFCVLPFISKDRLKLPSLLKWWDGADAYVGRDTSVYQKVCQMGWWPRYKWLALRNPLNYFQYVYMGLHWEGNEVYTRHDPEEDNVGDTTDDRPGFRHIEVTKGDRSYFEYYWIYRYPFARHVCFRYRLGWKISDTNNPKNSISQWVFVISPWKRYSGK